MIVRFAFASLIPVIACACSPELDRVSEPNVEVGEIVMRQQSGPPLQLKLLASKPANELGTMAKLIRDAGFKCNRLLHANELADLAGGFGVFKADCANGSSFRVTFVDDQHSVEQWSNNLFGNSNAIHN